jgi:hypothetical protein
MGEASGEPWSLVFLLIGLSQALCRELPLLQRCGQRASKQIGEIEHVCKDSERLERGSYGRMRCGLGIEPRAHRRIAISGYKRGVRRFPPIDGRGNYSNYRNRIEDFLDQW